MEVRLSRRFLASRGGGEELRRRAPCLEISGPLEEAFLVERLNRFLVRARLPHQGALEAHLPDPGRLTDLLIPGARLWLRKGESRFRKTRWSVVLVEDPSGKTLISVDTQAPNRLVEAALREEHLSELASWKLQRREFRLGRSRFDFLLQKPEGDSLVLEVKSVTWVRNGIGLFPDAVTARGTRHVEELTRLAQGEGWTAALLFIVQRSDARAVAAAADIDPRFARALEVAKKMGVLALARRCRVELDRISLGEALPVY